MADSNARALEFDLAGFSFRSAGRGFPNMGHWHSVQTMAKQHGSRPDQFTDLVPQFLGVNFCLRGSGKYTSRSGQVLPIVPGTLFHRFPGVRHSTWFDPQSDYAELFVTFDDQTAQHLIKLGLIARESVLHVGVDQTILDDFRKLQADIEITSTEVLGSVALSKAIAFLQQLYQRARHVRLQDYWERVIAEACLQMEAQVNERCGVEEIARRLSVPYTSFRKHFLRITGYSPGDYRIRARIMRARERLANNSVKTVAAELGYRDPFTFSAQFKAIVGTSPRHFQLALHSGAEVKDSPHTKIARRAR